MPSDRHYKGVSSQFQGRASCNVIQLLAYTAVVWRMRSVYCALREEACPIPIARSSQLCSQTKKAARTPSPRPVYWQYTRAECLLAMVQSNADHAEPSEAPGRSNAASSSGQPSPRDSPPASSPFETSAPQQPDVQQQQQQQQPTSQPVKQPEQSEGALCS